MPGPYPLATLAAQISSSGVHTPTFEDILGSLQTAYRQIYGADINLDADTQDGQWIAVQAQAFYDLNQAVVAAYLSYSPTYAQGAGLSSVVKINGIARLIPSKSTVDLDLIGQAGTSIPAGIVSDANNTRWVLPPDVTIPLGGLLTVTGTSEEDGDIHASPNTINIIQTMYPGWQTVTNPLAATPGRALETDAALRKRQTASVSNTAVTPRLAIMGNIAAVPGVQRYEVYDNDTDFYDVNGIPPHSIAAVVKGGDNYLVAKAIVYHKNVGCGTYGPTQVTVLDTVGVPQTVHFFRLIEVPIWVELKLRPLSGFQGASGGIAMEAVVEFINKQDIGADLYAHWLYAPAELSGDEATEVSGMPQTELDKLSATYVIEDILIGTTEFPAETDVITVTFIQATTCTIENVKVTIIESS